MQTNILPKIADKITFHKNRYSMNHLRKPRVLYVHSRDIKESDPWPAEMCVDMWTYIKIYVKVSSSETGYFVEIYCYCKRVKYSRIQYVQVSDQNFDTISVKQVLSIISRTLVANLADFLLFVYNMSVTSVKFFFTRNGL